MIKLRHRNSRPNALSSVRLFEGLTPAQLQEVRSLTTGVVFPEGKTLCHRGDRGSEFFIIQAGEVTLSNGVTLDSGEFFGEIALMRDAGRTASAVTTARTSVLVASRREFETIRQVDPRVARRLEMSVVERQPALSEPNA